MDNLTVVIPFWNGHQYIKRLVGSIPESVPVIIVDDQSDEPLHLKKPNVTVIRPERKGYFSGAVNAGAAACRTDFLVLNQDAWFDGNAWMGLIERNRPRYAAVGERIKGTHPAWPQGYIHGVFMWIKRDAWEAVGPFDEADYPLWGSTCLWQLMACRAGFEVLPVPSVPGLRHARGRGQNFGSSIRQALVREPEKKGLFVRTPPAVSVVVACYNYGRYLPDAVHSLVGGPTSLGDARPQTFQSFEVVIVDDGSGDETPAVGRALADPWKGIRYVRREANGGTAAANNTGIAASYGKYVAILCADDMMEPWRLEALYRLAEGNPKSMVYDDVTMFKAGNRFKHWRMREYDFDTLIHKNQVHAGIMFPRAAWEEVGGYPEEMRFGREDWAMNVRLGVAGYCGVHLKRPGYLYRREGHNRTLRNTTPAWHVRFRSQMEGLFPQIYAGARPMGCCGGRKTRKSSPAKGGGGGAAFMAKSNPGLPGKDGMTILEYQGRNLGTETFFGPTNGQTYVAGGSKRLILVDNRDLRSPNPRTPGLLDIREYGQPVFKVHVPKAELKVAKAEAERVNPTIREAESLSTEPAPEPVTLKAEEIEYSEGGTTWTLENPPEVQADDLTRIKGLGAATERKLNEAGIFTFYDVVHATELRQISEVTGIPVSKLEGFMEAARGLA